MTIRDLLMSAGGAGSTPVYVDDVFSTYLYTGTGATQSINNGIDLATKGGMTWIKSRSAATNNNLFDTVQGATKLTHSNTTDATITDANSLTAFNSNGFTLGTGNTTGNQVNTSAATYASWSFRKQPKFFDIVQYTGTGSTQAISHSLGSTAGCIMVKRTDTSGDWAVYHKGLNGGTTPQNYYTVLNTTAAQTSSSAWWNNTAPTSTQFTVGTDATVNASGGTYIAYIFADQAGGFGTTGTDNVISCGSFTTDGSGNASVTLGYEPQYVMIKQTNSIGTWFIVDIMRGFSNTQFQYIQANAATLEHSSNVSPSYLTPNATGFATGQAGLFAGSSTFIYMAIRRPMKPPTTGTSVFNPSVATPTSNPLNAANLITTNFSVDLAMAMQNSQARGQGDVFMDRLRGTFYNTSSFAGGYAYLESDTTAAESASSSSGTGYSMDNNNGYIDAFNNSQLGIANPVTYWNFRRASGFFDEVCYTGTGSATTQNHNLTVVPEMMIVKERSATNNWWVYHSATGNTKYSVLNTTAIPVTSSTAWNNTTPTASVFSIGTGTPVNTSGATYVAYLFATCAGVSKVGTYTGNATGQSIACGFGSGGARFILIKRTDSTGNWYCFDSANGLTSSSSPYMTWDTTNAQTTGNNGVYASSGGFTLGATASLTTNIATATYIFLAIS